MATVTTPNSQGLKVVNIHEAKTHLSRLVEEAANGQPFIIAKAGKPMVQVAQIPAGETTPSAEPIRKQRIGMLEGMYEVPDDFDTMFQDEIEAMFYGEE
jgi:antitoxin (DNA-binding transcriptional repressor) of toxin-antitoxin stability system